VPLNLWKVGLKTRDLHIMIHRCQSWGLGVATPRFLAGVVDELQGDRGRCGGREILFLYVVMLTLRCGDF